MADPAWPPCPPFLADRRGVRTPHSRIRLRNWPASEASRSCAVSLCARHRTIVSRGQGHLPLFAAVEKPMLPWQTVWLYAMGCFLRLFNSCQGGNSVTLANYLGLC